MKNKGIRGLFVFIFIAVTTHLASAAINFDNASSAFSSTDNTTISWSHTIGSGSNRMLIIGVGAEDTSQTDLVISSVKYNGVDMTLVAGSSVSVTGSSTYEKTELFYMLNSSLPSAGTYTVTVTYAGNVPNKNAGAVSLTGVAQTAREAVATSSNSSQSAISTNITTLTDGAWVVDAVVSSNTGTFTATGTGMTERWDVSASASSAAGSTRPVATAGLVTLIWQHTSTSGRRLAHSLAAFAAYEEPPAHPVGDLNLDWKVDWWDVNMFANQWLAPSGCPGTGCADFSGDGDVDFNDFAILAANWRGALLSGQPVINEVMAANDSTIKDNKGEYEDWIEIYNTGAEPIDIGGMYITDDLNEPNKWRIPSNAPTQTTIATHGYLVLWADNETTEGPNHVGFKLAKEGEVVGLYYSDLTLADSIVFGEQYSNISYGAYADGTENWRFMGVPTPGAQNSQGYLGLVDDVEISHPHGFYDSNFTVELFCEDNGATIRYTIDGNTPTETFGLVYDPNARIQITGTTCLRAIAYKAGNKASPVNTATYIFLNNIRNQNNAYAYSKGFPATWAQGSADYEMDPCVLNDPNYGNRFETAMKAIPTLSLVTDIKYLFDPTIGTYVNSWEWIEQPISVEYFDPCTGDDFQVNAGIRLIGNQSQDPSLNSKHALRIYFKSEYGPSELDFPPLYEGIGAKRLNTLSLRANYHYSWLDSTHQSAVPLASYLRDTFAQDTLRDMGWLSPYSRQIHLYLNGVYWGLYQLSERPDGPFLAEHKGGQREDYDAIEGVYDGTPGVESKEGLLTGWNYMYSLISGFGFDTPLDAAHYAEFEQHVDTAQMCDYIIYNTFVASWDWSSKNWMAGSGHDPCDMNGPPLGKWYFYSWDSETCMDDPYTGHSIPFSGYSAGPPCLMHNAVQKNPAYNRLLGDRIHKHLFNNGALTPQSNINRFDFRAERIENAIIGESARWGDFLRDTKGLSSYTLYTPAYWENERDRMVNPSRTNAYFPNRTNHMMTSRYPGWVFYPTVAAPVFSQFGGEIAAGSLVTITGGGTIYYTTDGREPNGYGTIIASGGTVTINNSLTLKARAYYTSGAKWSALNEATFAVGPVKDKLRITELMYHPTDLNDPNQEFVELKNIGTSALNLNLVRFTDGIGFTFPNMTLAAGDHVLVVEDINAFVAKYGSGKNVAGQYTGALANDGEHIRLEDAIGRTILDFEYSDNWQDATDGEGFSLNIFDANAEPNTWGKPESWAASKYRGGTPDTDDTALLRERSIAINELLAHQDAAPEDWIELKNTTSASINIGGWYISDDEENLTKYQIKSGTVLGTGQYLVLTEDANFGSSSTDPGKLTAFAFSEYGETAYLTSSEGGQLTGYREKEDFDASENSVAFGRYQKSTGTYNFVAMSSNTPGAANTYPKVGPVVINEIMYNPPDLNGQNSEYVELKNTTGSAVNLYDVNGVGWEFSDGIDYRFPSGTTIPANGYLLVVKTTPTYFRTRYSVPSGVTVLGPYGGNLSNAGEKLELVKPTDTDELGQIVYTRVDRVVYSDGSHPADCPEGVDLWPKEPDGGGKTLSRKFPLSYGNDPNNWQAAIPSPGAANP
jgi:hypothetical protein